MPGLFLVGPREDYAALASSLPATIAALAQASCGHEYDVRLMPAPEGTNGSGKGQDAASMASLYFSVIDANNRQ